MIGLGAMAIATYFELTLTRRYNSPQWTMRSATRQGEVRTPACGEVSNLLWVWGDRDRGALDRLTPIVYDERSFPVSAQSMGRILVEHVRRHNLKREGRVQHVSLDNAAVIGSDRTADLVACDDAMKTLARIDQRQVQVVELRFFGGLSVKETTEVLKVSSVTVMRDWSTAKAWLYRELTGGAADGS